MQYKIIVDKQSRTNPSSEKREYIVDIEELRVKGDVYDSLVITKDEDYVMRRLSLSEYQVLSVLETPVKEPLENINIELFEGDNYIYLIDMIGNKFYAEYIVKNDFTDLYVTVDEMNSAINLSASQIELSVNQKLTGYSTTEEMNSAINMKADEINQKVEKKLDEDTITGAYLILKINGDTSEAKLNADKIELTANDILNLIAGNAINLTSKNISIISDKFNVDRNGNVTVKDDGVQGNLTITNGVNFSTTHYSFGSHYNGDGGYVGIDTGYALAGGSIIVAPNQYEDTDYTMIQDGNITALTISQRSLEKVKKNIEKTKLNAIEIIKNSEIYDYNLKVEEDTDKKHIGFVIGDKYKTPNEVIAKSGEGIDTYSMSSIMWKAIQELTARIEELEKEIANGKN